MLIFKCNNNMCGEEWDRWNRYLENQVEECKPILLPQSIDYVVITEDENYVGFDSDFWDGDDDEFEDGDENGEESST